MAGIPIKNDRGQLKGDDNVVTFQFLHGDVVGRILRLGPAINGILLRHGLPLAASVALGEVLALAALLASALDEDGQIIVQTKTDGVVPVLVADCSANGDLRGYAAIDQSNCDASRLFEGVGLASEFVGAGHLAITIIQGAGGKDRYQGVTALDDGESIAEAAARYFAERESLEIYLQLSVGPTYRRASETGSVETTWRAGGLLLQTSSGTSDDDNVRQENWNRARILGETAEDHELLDPEITADRMLLRLFHEDGVRAEQVFNVVDRCRCSKNRIERMMASFSAEDLVDMRDENSEIVVTCEFCTKRYVIDA